MKTTITLILTWVILMAGIISDSPHLLGTALGLFLATIIFVISEEEEK